MPKAIKQENQTPRASPIWRPALSHDDYMYSTATRRHHQQQEQHQQQPVVKAEPQGHGASPSMMPTQRRSPVSNTTTSPLPFAVAPWMVHAAQPAPKQEQDQHNAYNHNCNYHSGNLTAQPKPEPVCHANLPKLTESPPCPDAFCGCCNPSSSTATTPPALAFSPMPTFDASSPVVSVLQEALQLALGHTSVCVTTSSTFHTAVDGVDEQQLVGEIFITSTTSVYHG